MRKNILLAVVFVVLFQCQVYPVGIRTKFSMAVLDNLAPGVSYNTRELVNLPYVLTNTGPVPISGKVVVDIPVKEMLVRGYEPVPDTNWVLLSKRGITLRPGESMAVDIIIYIPDKEEYYGRKFQAMIEATAGGGGNIAAGLATKLCFSTVKSKAHLKEIKETKKLLANLNYETLPERVLLRDIQPGKRYELREDFSQGFKIINMNDEQYTYSVKSVHVKDSAMEVRKGFESTPDPSFLKPGKDTVTVEDNTIEKIKVFLKIPDKKEYYGKRFQFYLEISLLGQAVPVRKYSFIYVETVSEKQ